MATNEGRVYFALNGDDFDPDTLTRFLNIEPTYVRRKGEKIAKTTPSFSSWALSTENKIAEHIDIGEMSAEIIDILKPRKEFIIEAMRRFNLSSRLEVVLYFSLDESHSTPPIGFESDTVKFLGDIGAFIDIDTYKH